MLYKPCKWLFYTLIALSWLGPSTAQSAPSPNMYSLRVANDSFFNQDHGYTSGVAFVVHPLKSPFSFYLGQDLYTPDKVKTPEPPKGQHPYGAWLYAGGEYRRKLSRYMLLRTELILGTTGERALGKEAQDVTHTILDFNEYQGWDSQISERWGWIFSMKLKGRLPVWRHWNAWGADILAHIEGRGGNIYVDANAGATLRLGLNIPDLEAIYTPQPETSLYITAGYDYYLVDRNVFLEGVKRSDYSVVPERTYARFRAGIHWRRDPYRIDLDIFWPEQYFKTQAEQERYGVVTLSYWF